MPVNKNRLRRLSAIVAVLNNCHEPINYNDLLVKVIDKTDQDVCKSTLEKDIYHLREEYDLQVKGTRIGLQLVEKVKFLELLKNHLNLFE